jgi:mannose-6-phosphate isomerase
MKPTDNLYPLTFEPIYKGKVWGGRSLEKLGRALPGDDTTRIGESWELADLATTSVSGGGGNAEHSVVANGPLKGKTIRQLMQTHGEALLGPGVALSSDGGFPLLIKFLDARENLSVQVHPSPAYAAEHPDAHLKSEAWYVVDAEPGAVIYKGLRPGVTAEQLRAALKTNTDDAVVPLLNAIGVKAGDCHYLPSGTLHALGAGVLVAEVQTPSDTTFRVYDWGRTDRELHIEQALACIDFSGKAPPATERETFEIEGMDSAIVASCEHFMIYELKCPSEAGVSVALEDEGEQSATREANIVMLLEGDLRFSCTDNADVQMRGGTTLLLPGTLQQNKFEAAAGSRWLEVVPAAGDR